MNGANPKSRAREKAESRVGFKAKKKKKKKKCMGVKTLERGRALTTAKEVYSA